MKRKKISTQKERAAAKEEARNLYPTAPDDLYWLGVISHSKELDFFGSYGYFSQALLLAPNHYWSRIERALFGRIPSEQDVRGRLQTEFEIAKTIRPDLPFASEFLVASKFNPAYTKKELRELIDTFGLDILRAQDMAELLQKEKKYDEAKTILLSMLVQDPGGRTAEQIGRLEYRRGNFEQARDWHRRAISEGTNNPVVYMNLAHALSAMRDWTGAERAYLEGIDQNPNRAFLYWNLGSWYERRWRFSDAEKTFRKGCELAVEIEGPSHSLAESEGDVRDFAQCHQSLAILLGRLGKRAETIQLLQGGIARLEKVFEGTSQVQKVGFIEEQIMNLKGSLCRACFDNGRREEVLSIITAELRKKPLRSKRARIVIDNLQALGKEQAALEAARLAEFTTWQELPSSDKPSRLAASIPVNGQLRRMGLFNELRDRLETQKALGDELGVPEYRWLGTTNQGAQAEAILSEAVKKYPDSMELHTDYMQVLAKSGRKEEAWNAYERARDLYFAQVERNKVPVLPVDYQEIKLGLPPGLVSSPWYTYLMQEGKDDELDRLEDRLRKACTLTQAKVQDLLLPRATAEFAAGRYAAAAKSFEVCLQRKLWNELANEAMITAGLAKSLQALGHRQQAMKWYQRAVQLSNADPGLLSEFLQLVVQEQGVDGLSRELAPFDQTWLNLNVRPNATLDCLSAWAALAKGDEKRAFEKLVSAGPFFLQASRQSDFVGDEALACAITYQIVAEKLADSKRLAWANEFLKRFPSERVKAMKEIFSLKPK